MKGRISVRVHLNVTDEFEVPADVRQPHSLLLHGKTIKNRAVRHVCLLQGIRLFSSIWCMTWNSLYSVPCGCLLAISSQSAECLFWVFGSYQLLLAYLTEKALREQTYFELGLWWPLIVQRDSVLPVGQSHLLCFFIIILALWCCCR